VANLLILDNRGEKKKEISKFETQANITPMERVPNGNCFVLLSPFYEAKKE
jgi:hypothetical protein